jgi:predicted nucleic acid-binding protein
MRIVVDANMLIAALIKNGKAREILLSGKFEFVSPGFVKDEMYKYYDYIRNRAQTTKKELDLLIEIIFKEIVVVPSTRYNGELNRAKALMKEDTDDVPYVACYFALKCDAIWTHDPHFYEKHEIKIVRTSYLIKLL